MASAAKTFYWPDLWYVASLRVRRSALWWREVTADGLAGGSLLLAFAIPEPSSVLTGASWAFLGMALIAAGVRFPSRSVMYAGAFLLVALVLSVALAGEARIATSMVAISVAPMAVYGLLNVRLDRVMTVVTAGAAANGFIIVAQALSGALRPAGLSTSPNPASGLLALSAVWLLTTRRKWLAAPLLVPMLLTGSRMAAGAFLVAGVAILITDRRSRFQVAAILAVFLALAFSSSRLAGIVDEPSDTISSARERLSLEFAPSVLPTGFVQVGDGPPHNVPLRLAVELGIPAAAVWMFMSGKSLWRRPDRSWWLLLTVLLLATLDYYVWVGPLAGFWWLLVATAPVACTPGGRRQ